MSTPNGTTAVHFLHFGRTNRLAVAIRRIAIFVLTLLTVVPVVHAQQASAADPDYSGVKDILHGRRSLVAVDDLVIGGSVLKTSEGSKIEDKNIYELPGFQRREGDSEILAHLFNSKSGTLVYTHSNKVYAIDPVAKNTTSLVVDEEFRQPSMASGDFRLDGVQEIVIASRSGLRLIRAVDPREFSKGLYSGPLMRFEKFATSMVAVAVGDFDGDGHPGVAVAYDALFDRHRYLNIYEVDPQTLALQLKHTEAFPEMHAGLVVAASLAAGRFGTTVYDQLLLGYSTTTNLLEFRSFDFDGSLTPILKDTRDASDVSLQELNFVTGRFDPISPFNQVAVKLNLTYSGVEVGIISFDHSLKIQLPSFVPLPGIHCSSGGLAVGDFARTEPAPQGPSKAQPSLKFQLAISSSNCAGSLGVNIYNIDPPSTTGQDFIINPNAVLSRSLPQTADYGLPIIAGDIQGRSVNVGEPTKVVIEDTAQPSVIAAMPPMHVDFMRPAGGGEATLLNLSAIPDGFRTVYETNETNTSQSSTTNTSSWSFGTQVSLEAAFEIGSVEGGLGLEVGATAQAAQDIKTFNEKEYGTYRRNTFDASVKTGFADQVWYTQSRFNIFVYPVLDHKVCPSGKPDCAEDEKIPLTIQFSAPDKIESQKVDGNLIPWYQPPWEPGNIFSYPANYEQLQKIADNIQLLSDAQTSRTDTSTATERASWTTETTGGATASVDQNNSFALGLSISGAWSAGITSGTASASLNLSGSSGFSDLNKSVTSVGRSAGVGVEKPGTFLVPPSYSYAFTPYIFGQVKPGSVVDNEPLNADVQTFGLLRTAFTADPARHDAGSWWQRSYHGAPDVALNHPSRWHWRQVAVENPLPPNCLNVGFGGTNMDCIDLQQSRPDNLWESNFHVMRGFFISNALSPGKGPQLTTAKAGDKLTLQTRVYNYSFEAMPANSQVHVRFYAQQIDKDNGHQPVGDSVLINNADVILLGIPPFRNDNDAPLNWVLARTEFDTKGFDGQYLICWVVVWIEDGTGNLVPETEGHGLRSAPGTLKSLADVQAEMYSNNVGFYNSAFYVFPEQSVTEATSRDGEPATIHIARTRLSGKRVSQGQMVDVSAQLIAENNSASGVTALFYDGDPHAGGTVFGLERIPYIAETGTYQVEAPYNAGACGKHELFIALHEGTPDAVLWPAGKVKVHCRRGRIGRLGADDDDDD